MVLVVAATAAAVWIFLLLTRVRLGEQIKEAERELKQARDHGRAGDAPAEPLPHTVIVHAHDRLVRYRGDLRRMEDYARRARVVLIPVLAGGLLAMGYTLGALPESDDGGRPGTYLDTLERTLDTWRHKERALEDALTQQAQRNTTLATQVEAYAQQKDQLQARLSSIEYTLAEEKQERIKLEVLVGKAEQRLNVLEHAQLDAAEPADALRGIKAASPAAPAASEPVPVLEVPPPADIDESDVEPDGLAPVMADGTTLYTGHLEGQIAFERSPHGATPDVRPRQIYVLVRWGDSRWIVAEGRARITTEGAVEGPFKVILPLNTIRTLDVTAIATDKEYRRYQYVPVPEHTWKASIATIPVRPS